MDRRIKSGDDTEKGAREGGRMKGALSPLVMPGLDPRIQFSGAAARWTRRVEPGDDKERGNQGTAASVRSPPSGFGFTTRCRSSTGGGTSVWVSMSWTWPRWWVWWLKKWARSIGTGSSKV